MEKLEPLITVKDDISTRKINDSNDLYCYINFYPSDYSDKQEKEHAVFAIASASTAVRIVFRSGWGELRLIKMYRGNSTQQNLDP